jgi:hypothetical protein
LQRITFSLIECIDQEPPKKNFYQEPCTSIYTRFNLMRKLGKIRVEKKSWMVKMAQEELKPCLSNPSDV